MTVEMISHSVPFDEPTKMFGYPNGFNKTAYERQMETFNSFLAKSYIEFLKKKNQLTTGGGGHAYSEGCNQ